VDATTGPNTPSSASISDRVCGEVDCGSRPETGQGTISFGRSTSVPKKRRGTERSVPRSLPSGLVGQLLLSLASLDRRPPRDASPPFLPAILASSLVNSCAVPFWWAARPPFAAIARCAWGSIAANPRGVLRLTPPVLRVSAPLSPLVPLIVPLPPPPTPLLRMLRSSILSPLLSAWSAIIYLLPRIFEFVSRGRWTSILQAVDCPDADRV